jgi:hypothetical protein
VVLPAVAAGAVYSSYPPDISDLDQEDIPMKSLFVRTAVVFAFGAALAVRAQAPQDAPTNAPKEHSMTGCLQKGTEAGAFKLTNVEKGPSTVEIAESTAKLDPHVTHKVEITGTAITGKDPNAHTMKVTAVKMLGATCP